ncbi:MAG: BatD family protein, partial [Planctomycetes bacterium]|nr:BatD family protein [Planctomycetota bacterium]
MPRAIRHGLVELLAVLGLAGLDAAEAKLELPDPLVPGVVLQGTIQVEDATTRVTNVALPPVAGLEWQVQQGGMQAVRSVNGVVTRSETVRLAVRAQMADTFRIPAVTVTLADGSTITTTPVTVTASAANQNLQGDAFAETAFEPPAIVAGEPTTLVYRIYLRQNNDKPRALRQCDLAPPAGALPLGERSESEGQTCDARGNPWRIRTFRWPLTWALPGTYQAGGQQGYVICRQDFFGQLSPIADRTVAIRPATLTVAALPEAGRPADFNGLFGPLTITAALERPRIASGEGTVLMVTIDGRQTELITRPVLAVPAGMKAYPKDDDEPAHGTAAARDQRPLNAVPGPHQRSFRWDLVPDRAGEFSLPALTLAYFDPGRRAYDHAHGPELTLTVLPGRAANVSITGKPLGETAAAAATPQLLLP